MDKEWKLEKRWIKQNNNNHDIFLSINSNNDYLLFYTNKSIQLCSVDLIIQYSIDLTSREHFFSHFIYLSQYQIWLTIDKQTQILNYFHVNNRIIQTIDQIYLQAISSMGDELALVTKDDYHLQIVSI
jgi:hypothetical protein